MNPPEMPRGLGGCDEFGSIEMRAEDTDGVISGYVSDDSHTWADYWFTVERMRDAIDWGKVQ